MRIICGIIAFAIVMTSTAQEKSLRTIKEEFQCNKSISWAGMVDVDYKNDDQSIFKNTVFLEQLFELGNSIEKENVYKDSDCVELYRKGELQYSIKETQISFHPETFNEIRKEVVTEFKAEDIESLRLRQIVYFDEDKQQFFSQPFAIAPIIREQPFFWVRVSSINTDLEKNKKVNFAAKIDCENELITVNLFKKNEETEIIFKQLIKHITGNVDDLPLESIGEDGKLMEMPNKKVRELETYLDTIITLDPETYEQIVQVVEHKVDGTTIYKLGLMQYWYWNEKEQHLYVRHLGFSPIRRKKSKNKEAKDVQMFIYRQDK